MTSVATSDLALIAERRAGLAAAAGLLLLEEPGPELAGLVANIDSLAPLGSADPALRAEYARLFVHGVPLYESVFRSDDGQHGGAPLGEVVASFERLGFDEHRSGRWRVAGADHLGVELRCFAHLCHVEAVAWRSGTPDEAMRAVEHEREFLAAHLAVWVPLALDAARELAGEGPYAAALDAIAEFLDGEFDRLRPAPDLGSEVSLPTLPTSAGSTRVASILLAPARCGAWLGTAVLATAAGAIGMPWRQSDTRAQFRYVLDGLDATEMATVLAPIVAALGGAADRHRERATRVPGNAANAVADAAHASSTVHWLQHVADQPTPRSPAQQTITFSADDPAALDAFVTDTLARAADIGISIERDAR